MFPAAFRLGDGCGKYTTTDKLDMVVSKNPQGLSKRTSERKQRPFVRC